MSAASFYLMFDPSLQLEDLASLFIMEFGQCVGTETLSQPLRRGFELGLAMSCQVWRHADRSSATIHSQWVLFELRVCGQFFIMFDHADQVWTNE